MKPTLLIMAAGIGSRYGSLKQIDRVGPSGETIMDYSVFDAIRAGFGKIVFIISKGIEKEFKEALLNRLKDKIDADYVFQKLEDMPKGIKIPPGRKKPWGTSHAVLVCEPKVKEPFAVINADDFYGLQSFKLVAKFLSNVDKSGTLYSLVGYKLANTLSEHGGVARAICRVGESGLLTDIIERLHVEKTAHGIFYKDEKENFARLLGTETVSMNFWGFTPSFFEYAREEFERFIRENYRNPKAELYIPLVIQRLIKSGRCHIRVLESKEKWFGITYMEDKPRVIQELKNLVDKGIYPRNLWI